MGSETFKLYFNEDNLNLAYHRVICWPERLVKDRFGIQAFAYDLQTNIKKLSHKLLTNSYSPQLGFKYYEPKSSGTQRTKTLLMIEDALVYQAIANIIAEKNYSLLAEHDDFVFGSVLTPETRLGTALFKEDNPQFFFYKFWKNLFIRFKDSIIKAIEVDKATFKFETDITGFFDSIPHYNLLLTLSNNFNVEDEILDLLSICLNAWSGTKESNTPGVGIPQGPQPSYLLANLLLYPLDKQLISEAFKYYRYMDDIKIYGYSESELKDVLVLIDNYLKGHGLSINSKKTGITLIEAGSEDQTVKELKRFEVLGNDYAKEEIILENLLDGLLESNIVKDLLGLSDQSPEGDVNSNLKLDTLSITEKEEIINFWLAEIKHVEEELPKLFKSNSKELTIQEKIDDIDFIRLSAKYGTSIRSLSEYQEIPANEALLPYWLFAIKKFNWRANNFILTLQHYKNHPGLKLELIKIYSSDKNYEWFRYHIINCLNYNFNFTDRELREFIKYLKSEDSELVKYAIYCLIIKHTEDAQLQSTIRIQLSKEKTNYLKLITLNYWKSDKNRIQNLDDLIKQLGL